MTFAVEKAFDIVLDALIEKSKDEIDDTHQRRRLFSSTPDKNETASFSS